MNKDKKEQKSMFGRGKEKILKCFYRNKKKELYFSEILRETGLTQNTTLKHLANLQKLGLIISTKKIGNTFYKINQKILFFMLFLLILTIKGLMKFHLKEKGQ